MPKHPDSSSAEPAPGSDSDTLSVTQRIEREEFARGHIAPGEDPAQTRPAATIILAREAAESFEVLLLRRPDTTRFAAGAYVFAGGVIDAADDAPSAIRRLPCPPADSDGPALLAAFRELFEETGFLLADQAFPWADLEPIRDALLRGDRVFADVVADLDLTFDTVRVAYISRWITPERFARRYDTRFYLAAADLREPRLTEELAGFEWMRPADAVRRFRAGELPMLFPTRVTLERLATDESLDGLLERYAHLDVQPVMPRLVVSGDIVRPVLPGDPLFEDAKP